MRIKLSERRLCINIPIVFTSVAGPQYKIVITAGYDAAFRLKEVFCADFKAGSDNQALIMDACILLSRLLQHGDTPQELLESMCSPLSLIGTICQAICAEQNLAIQDGMSQGFKHQGKPNVDGLDS